MSSENREVMRKMSERMSMMEREMKTMRVRESQQRRRQKEIEDRLARGTIERESQRKETETLVPTYTKNSREWRELERSQIDGRRIQSRRGGRWTR